MSPLPPSLVHGALYLAAFAQARAPHVGLLIPYDNGSGYLVHIYIDRQKSPFWAFQCRKQKLAGDMFLTSLLMIGLPGSLTVAELKDIAMKVEVPLNDTFGECLPWARRVVDALHRVEKIEVTDVDTLFEEFSRFAAGNSAYARRDRFPNVAVSTYCTTIC
ncbi:hypothetical protein FISHEDRAFT_36285 [Fistulina hepatica ATCC 64428]|uniref:Uncharacterized protein n=1 Tax=Fistulina hepatica ATCC 64428 TaxID=1128425 RepID=A0A0D7AM98_9AGAR|nr:hypothetical protein FISHEDRAFT_36285 [Fistulina hepatica ATCC 64428]